MALADIILPQGEDSDLAISLIAQNVMTQLQQRGFKLKDKISSANFVLSNPITLHLLPSNPHIRDLQTIIQNKNTPRDEFIFYS